MGGRAELLTLGAVARRAAALLVEIVVAIGLAAGGSLAHDAHGRRRLRVAGEIGQLFLTDHLLAFEITSIVLLIAAVGGVVLGAHARARNDGEWCADGPDVAWYLALAAFLFAIGALGVLDPAQPADRPALARADAERRQPRADRASRATSRTAPGRSSASP